MRRWQLGLVGSVLSAFLLIALYPPWGLTLFAPLTLVPLLYAIAYQPCPGRRFAWGLLTGTLFWGFTCHWIQDVLLAYGGLDGPLSWLALLLFAVAKGSIIGFFALLAGWLVNRAFAIPAIAALWTGMERLNGPQGFAWLTLGNAGTDMAIPLRIAPWLGVYGLSFLFALMATAVTGVALRRSRRELAWLAPALLLFLLPAIQLDKPPTQTASALQPALPDRRDWTQEELRRTIRQFSLNSLSNAIDPSLPRPALIIWPEVPAPLYYYTDASFRDLVTDLARVTRTPFLFGTVAFTPDRRPLNSAVYLNPNGRLGGRYDKIKLVPFGEFIPPFFNWIEKISSEAGDYLAGERVELFSTGSQSIGAFICYESAFPDLVRQFPRQGAQVLVNLTNDGYFGRSSAREQHLLLARMRAVENGRWLLRVANDGTTASIDPSGRTWDRLPPFQRAAGRLRFDWISAQTFYTRNGDWFAWLCLAAGLGACVAALAMPRPGQ